MPPPALTVLEALQQTALELVGELGEDAKTYLSEAATAVNAAAQTFLAEGQGDPAYVISHVRARLTQLSALHLMRQEAKVRDTLITTGLAILRGLIAVAPAV